MKSEDQPLELYQPDLLAYAKEYPMMRARPDAQHIIKAYNPYCGDKFEVYFDLEEGLIENASFFGYGCIVSKASTGMLAERLDGKTINEAKTLVMEFLNALGSEDQEELSDGSLQMLMASRKYPGRMRCASLAWEALLQSEVV